MSKNQEGSGEPQTRTNGVNSNAMTTDGTSKVCNAVTGRCNAAMSIEELNEYLVKEASAVCRHFREARGKTGHTSGIIPPICSDRMSLKDNIKNLLACFNNTLSAALFSEREYIRIFRNFETLTNTIDSERYLIFDFLSENGMAEKFNDYVNEKRKYVTSLKN